MQSVVAGYLPPVSCWGCRKCAPRFFIYTTNYYGNSSSSIYIYLVVLLLLCVLVLYRSSISARVLELCSDPKTDMWDDGSSYALSIY